MILCEAVGVEFSFAHPENEQISSLDGHIRRNVFLIFKETLRNAIRHGHCRSFNVTCEKQKGTLLFIFEDDGHGFDHNDVSFGQGLISITRRAKSVSGCMRIKSSPGSGTKIELSVPIKTKLMRGIGRF